MALSITLGLISRPSAKMLSLAQHADYAQHLSVYDRLTNTILQGLMMVSIHGPDDLEFDFRTAMNIWGKLRKRHILVENSCTVCVIATKII
jgi:hypothetical protein